MHTHHYLTAAIILATVLNACAHVPYDTGAGSANPDNVKLRAYEPQTESGRPVRVIIFNHRPVKRHS